MKNLVVLLLMFFVPLVVAIPEDLNVNGRLTNSLGNPLSGSYSMNFSIAGRGAEEIFVRNLKIMKGGKLKNLRRL